MVETVGGSVGRDVALVWNAVAILGVREKGVSLNGEPVNVTSDEDNGWQKLLTKAAENSVEVSLSGVTKSERLRKEWFAGTRTRTASITWPNGGVLSGTFMIASYSEGQPYNDAITFECTLQSSGEVTYVPAAT